MYHDIVRPDTGSAPAGADAGKRYGTEYMQEGEPLTLQQSLSVILPAHNEEEVIITTVSSVLAAFDRWAADAEVIIVNDGSTDRTGELLAALAQTDQRVRVITHPVNQGYGAALIHGFEAITKELGFFMDSDGQFDIDDLRSFFPYVATFDAVIGYRIDRQDAWLRKVNAWGWKQLVRLVLGVHVRDIDCAFKVYKADFIHRHHFETQGAMINTEMLYKLKRDRATLKEIGVHHLPRSSGQATGANPKVILRAFKELFQYSWKWRQPLRNSTETPLERG